jgi:hypothetical protein
MGLGSREQHRSHRGAHPQQGWRDRHQQKMLDHASQQELVGQRVERRAERDDDGGEATIMAVRRPAPKRSGIR